jgi:hypothetical protein
MTKQSHVGDESVVIGNDPPSHVGDRSVVVGATDADGNTRIDGGTAIGYRAWADESSVAIGAHAGAGTRLVTQLGALRAQLEEIGAEQGAQATAELLEEIQAPNPDTGRVAQLWKVVSVATANGAVSLLAEIAKVLPLPH